jgi:hypothetical protein
MEKRSDFDYCVQKTKEDGAGKPPHNLRAVYAFAGKSLGRKVLTPAIALATFYGVCFLVAVITAL